MDIVTAEDIKNFHADIFYQFYLSTIEKKWGGAYLNKKFWHLLIENLKNRIVFIFAKENNENIAGAINLIDNNAIYGSAKHPGLLGPIGFWLLIPTIMIILISLLFEISLYDLSYTKS